jgi:predicted negative regulator of RcsB-dependent stress response
MESYRTEEEQVEAMRRWWDENGRSILVAVVLALAAGFGWQGWQDMEQRRAENASHLYHVLLESLNANTVGEPDFSDARSKAEQIITEYGSTSYAQFAALHLAKLAAKRDDLAEAQTQLRWVLSKAPGKSDIAEIAQLRLARVLAASGETTQALDILAKGQGGAFAASYAIARGDIYLQLDRADDARNAYAEARSALAQSGIGGSVATLDQKIQSLNPVPARVVPSSSEPEPVANEGLVEPDDTDTAVKQEG